MIQITLLTIAFFCIPFFQADAQVAIGNVRGFSDYLESIGEYRRAAQELERLLVQREYVSDSLPLYIGSLYQKAGAYNSAQRTFQYARLNGAPQLREDFAYNLAVAYYQQQQYDSALTVLKELPHQPRSLLMASLCKSDQGMFEDAMRELETLLAIDSANESVVTPIRSVVIDYMQLPHKSPLIAGILSAIVPGSGKVYTGQYNDALLSFLTIAGLTYAAYDGFSTQGSGSTRGWIYGSLAGGLYLGNIYGSALSASIVRDDATHTLQTRIRAAFSLAGVP